MRGLEVEVDVGDGRRIEGTWTVPADPRGVVVFAHGSGSGRHSPRNRTVADAVERAGFATLSLDLLTPDEDEIDALTAQRRFDIPLLSGRLRAALDWLGRSSASMLPIGLFGASTGAAVALVAAAEQPARIDAIVARGGRPDLAGAVLSHVHAPTLLIVGGRDDLVLEMNERAAIELMGTRELYVVPGATHLFEEPGALELVCDATRAWFELYMRLPAEPAAHAEAP